VPRQQSPVLMRRASAEGALVEDHWLTRRTSRELRAALVGEAPKAFGFVTWRAAAQAG